MQTTEQIIDIIIAYKLSKQKEFAIEVKLDGDKAKSKALLQAEIDLLTKTVFPTQEVECYKSQIYWNYIEKEKVTYFRAMLFCSLKGNTCASTF